MWHIGVLVQVLSQVGLAPQFLPSRRAQSEILLAFSLAIRPSDALLNPPVRQLNVLGVDRGR